MKTGWNGFWSCLLPGANCEVQLFSNQRHRLPAPAKLGQPHVQKSIQHDASQKSNKQSGGADFVEMRNREIVAIIAYLQRLGTDIKVKDLETTQN